MNTRPVTCEQALLVLMGEVGDDTREDVLAARLHASRCPRCGAAYDPAYPGAAVLGALTGRRSGAATSLLLGLLAISLAQLVLAIPWLVGRSLLPDSHVAVSHLTRDGALGLVIASLGLVTVWRPRYVHSTRIVGLLVLGLQLIAGLADQQMSSISDSFEVVHFLVVIIVLGLFAAAADLARRATPSAEPKSRVLHARPRVAGRRAG